MQYSFTKVVHLHSYEHVKSKDIMFGSFAPVIVAFDQLAHYYFGSRESLNAADVHRVNVSVKEAMNDD